MDRAIVDWRSGLYRTSQEERSCGIDGIDEIAQITRWREVLILLGDTNFLDTSSWCESGDHRFHQFFWRTGTCGDSDDSGEIAR